MTPGIMFLMYSFDRLVAQVYIIRTLAGGWGEPEPTRASIGHGCTTRGPAQRGECAKRRPRQVQWGNSAAEDSIKAGARKPRPNWPRPPARGCLYRRVLCARRRDRGGGGFRASARGKAKAALKGLERVMNLGKNRIEMRIPRSAWFPRDLRFPHS
jgi:hypothetical protein